MSEGDELDKVIDKLNDIEEPDWEEGVERIVRNTHSHAYIIGLIAEVHPKFLYAVAQGGDWINEVRHLIKKEKHIAAIKLYRDRSGIGLKEAKQACDKIRDEMEKPPF